MYIFIQIQSEKLVKAPLLPQKANICDKLEKVEFRHLKADHNVHSFTNTSQPHPFLTGLHGMLFT